MTIFRASLLLLTGLSASAVAAAQACSGKLVGVKDIRPKPENTKLGEVQLYWDAAANKSCARTMHTAQTWGKARWTYVILNNCERKDLIGGFCHPETRRDIDMGVFKYQAGPVALVRKNSCVDSSGYIETPGGRRFFGSVSGGCR